MFNLLLRNYFYLLMGEPCLHFSDLQTALHYAAKYGDCAAIRLLLGNYHVQVDAQTCVSFMYYVYTVHPIMTYKMQMIYSYLIKTLTK
ncbi:unnamed protein product [Schistosoma margrebowiei]|uniref:Uncharacterized protein n=1 Tax=Schistosoma margrebowiei TaxID=48269 RepID=A0A183NBF4_9TREM|nr:unnamed protein product [Schistosoma margrebowiei]